MEKNHGGIIADYKSLNYQLEKHGLYIDAWGKLLMGYFDTIIVEKENIPKLIKILQSFVVMLLLSVSVFGQSAPKGATTAELIPHIGHYLSQSNDVLWDSGKSDTVAVYMLVTKKVTHDYPLELRQIKGYSVTPRIAYNSLPIATYLDNNKKPMPDDCIVWMSVKR